MKTIKGIIAEKTPETITDFFLIHKRIEAEKQKRKAHAEKTMKIALVSSFTTKGIEEVLNVKCCSLGIMPDFYVAPYNQYAQEILNKASLLYKSDHDLVIIFIDTMSLFGEIFFSPYRLSDEERKEIAKQKYSEIITLIKTLSEKISGKIIFHNFEVPAYSPLGILENKQGFGFIEMVRTLNSRLAEAFKDNSQIFIFDYDLFCSKHGKKEIFDYKMYYLGDIKLNLNLIPVLCEEYMGFIKPIMSLTRKCIVLDLDNTLWGGVIGEDSLEGIRLGLTTEGRPYLEFQRYLISLHERGVILAINSRNNADDSLRVLREHPYAVLKEEHFASIKINWNDKLTNIREIAKEINIGLDSLVFIDDDRVNRELVKKSFPEVYVLDLPDDPSLYVRALIEVNDFNTLQITEEDKRKSMLYATERKRKKVQVASTDISEFLKGLDIRVTIMKADSFTIPRISQLTQKTNQFNMTTRRYLEEDIRRFAKSDDYLIFSAKVEDKFGDSGITGAVIIKKEDYQWTIDTFLLSCRVLGRNVEEALMTKIIEYAKIENARKIVGIFVPTAKNKPAIDFYKRCGFNKIRELDGRTEYDLKLTKEGFKAPAYIDIVER